MNNHGMVIDMLKKVCIALLMLAIICSITLQGSINISEEDGKAIAAEKLVSLDAVFKASGCEWMQLNVNGWAMLNYSDCPMDRMKEIVLKAAEFFNLEAGYDIFTNENDFMRQANISGITSEGDLVNVIISCELSSGRKEETYIVVDIISKDRNRQSKELVKRQEEFFESLAAEANISTTFTGTFAHEFNSKEQEKLCVGIFESVEGEISQVLNEDGLLSMAGYSPRIRNKLDTGEGAINLQVAMRYSSYWGKTFIWLGSPIITTEY